MSKIDINDFGRPGFDWNDWKGDTTNRIGQVWLARSDSSEQEYEPYVVVAIKSYDQFAVFGWELVSLDERQDRFGLFESQFHAVERGTKDLWVLKRVS